MNNDDFTFNIAQPTLKDAQKMQKNMSALNMQLNAELEKDIKDQDEELIANLKSQLGITGGRRHRGSKKMHKGKRHGNASLRAWVTFVKKVQKEEGVSYKEAMTRAKQRKDKGEKWHGGAYGDDNADYGPEMQKMFDYDNGNGEEVVGETVVTPPIGGRRRRRHRTQRRSRSHSRSHKRSRSHRRSRRHH